MLEWANKNLYMPHRWATQTSQPSNQTTDRLNVPSIRSFAHSFVHIFIELCTLLTRFTLTIYSHKSLLHFLLDRVLIQLHAFLLLLLLIFCFSSDISFYSLDFWWCLCFYGMQWQWNMNKNTAKQQPHNDKNHSADGRCLLLPGLVGILNVRAYRKAQQQNGEKKSNINNYNTNHRPTTPSIKIQNENNDKRNNSLFLYASPFVGRFFSLNSLHSRSLVEISCSFCCLSFAFWACMGLYSYWLALEFQAISRICFEVAIHRQASESQKPV